MQRWEALFGMPVHRPARKGRSAVVAFATELELWLRSPRTQVMIQAHSDPIARTDRSIKQASKRLTNTQQLINQTDLLQRRTMDLMDTYMRLNQRMIKSLSLREKWKLKPDSFEDPSC